MKKQRKQQTLSRTTALVLLVTMIALVMVSGTFARYAQEFDGSGTAIVAKWAVDVTDLDDNTITDSTTFNLFNKSAIYDLDGVTDPDDLSGETGVLEADVAKTGDGDTKAIVAPGTWGKVAFKVKVENTNQVKVKYGVNVTTLTNNITELEFSTDGTHWGDASTISSLAYAEVAPGAEVDETYELYWRWLYNPAKTNDATDTGLGETGTATCVIKATFGAVQVD